MLLVCFWPVEKHTPDRVVRKFGMVQEIPPNVDTDEALHAIDPRGKMTVNWRDRHYGKMTVNWRDRHYWKMMVNWKDRHYGHIQVWNSRARSLCHGARLKGDMSPAHPYFNWYGRVTWRFVDHTMVAFLIIVIASTFLFNFCCVSPFLC